MRYARYNITMKKPKQLELDLAPCEPPPTLNKTEAGNNVLIFLGEQLLYTIRKDDVITKRYVATQIFLNQLEPLITQQTIANLFGVSRGTIHSWIKTFRAEGIKGLEPLRKKATKLTPKMISDIAILKAQKVTRIEISRKMGIHVTSVDAAFKKIKNYTLSQDFLPSLKNFQEDVSIQDTAIDQVDEKTESTSEIKPDQADQKTVSASEIKPNQADQKTEETSLIKASQGDVVYGSTYDEGIPEEARQALRERIDPLDRSEDRMLAVMGLLDDAEPIFAEHEHVEDAGSLLAVAMLTQDCFLSSIEKTYGSLGPSFFGLRNTFMCFFLMAVTRIKNINSIEKKHGSVLGRLLGLDRSPCTRTLRRKIDYLASRKQGLNTMNLIAGERISEFCNTKLNVNDVTLYLDGHIHKYSGKEKFSKTFSTSKNRVVKGASDYYLNLPDGTPLLVIPTDFNQSMFEVMPTIVIHAKKLCKDKRLTIVFDRGGSSAKTYETIKSLDCDFIAYHKSPTAIDEKLFKLETTEINGTFHKNKPYDHKIKLDVKERHGATYKKTSREVEVREVVVLRDDGKQTSILTSRFDLKAELVATTIFQRWTQENYFKYALAHYNIDALCSYKTEAVDSEIDRPNPEYADSSKRMQTIRKRMATLMRHPNEKIIEKEFELQEEQLGKLYTEKKRHELTQLSNALNKEKEFRQNLDKRISATDYRKFNDEIRLVSNLVKMTAYNIEGKMAKLLGQSSNYKNGNERGIINHFTHTSGAISIADKTLKIDLQQQGTPAKTKELQDLCQEINKLNAIYPGTNLSMKFSVQAC